MSRKKIVIVAVAVAALGAGGFFLRPGASSAAQASPRLTETAPEEGAIVEVAQMTVNLAGPDLRYARVTFAVVLAATAVEEDVRARLPLLQDAALSEIGSFTPEALRAAAGADQLRDRLSERAGALFGDGVVLRVVLTELLVQ